MDKEKFSEALKLSNRISSIQERLESLRLLRSNHNNKMKRFSFIFGDVEGALANHSSEFKMDNLMIDFISIVDMTEEILVENLIKAEKEFAEI